MPTLGSDSRPIIGRGPSLWARLFALGALSVVIMTLDHRQGYLEMARGWLSMLVYPMQSLVDLPFRSAASLRNYFADRERLQRENEQLRGELRVANLQSLRYAALDQENRQLRAIRAASADIQARTAVAEIMRVDIDPRRHRVLLNKGGADGLYKGQAVLDAHGVFGQVTRVNRYTSEAILVTDAEMATPVRVNRTGLRTLAIGSGNFEKLNLPYILSDSDVNEGDLLVTSGLGGIFPPGYPVAVVAKVKRKQGEAFAVIDAKPAARMDHARELLLVWFEPPSADEIKAAPAADSKTAGGRP